MEWSKDWGEIEREKLSERELFCSSLHARCWIVSSCTLLQHSFSSSYQNRIHHYRIIPGEEGKLSIQVCVCVCVCQSLGTVFTGTCICLHVYMTLLNTFNIANLSYSGPAGCSEEAVHHPWRVSGVLRSLKTWSGCGSDKAHPTTDTARGTCRGSRWVWSVIMWSYYTQYICVHVTVCTITWSSRSNNWFSHMIVTCRWWRPGGRNPGNAGEKPRLKVSTCLPEHRRHIKVSTACVSSRKLV